LPDYKYGRTLRERLFSRLIAEPSGCLVWTGHKDEYGYGRIQAGTGRPQYVHRVVYLLEVGQIPDGLELDHLCMNPSCASPAHLEAVTHAENMRRRALARKAAV
jgi:hypothetical protein